MTDKPARDTLCRRWLHSHEEDTAQEMVYRPAGFSFPPSRGRIGFELHPDGSLVWIGIGRGDVPVEAEGTWRFDEEEKILGLEIESSPGPTFEVIAAAADRLVFRKP
jgi:hypothetical protein